MGVYLVTGAMGCIGAWTVHHLLKRGETVISFDLSEDRKRLNLLMREEQQQGITFVKGDLTHAEQITGVVGAYGVTHIIHLAALQIPLVRANPILGAQVNVTGTINIFEAARQHGLAHVAYASSIAVYGPREDYPPGLIAHDAQHLPRTLYGVFKVANEQSAQVYHQEHGITSTALRPYTVYGLGRDQGLTSEPTTAMRNAANDEDTHITFGGNMQFHLASDVAHQFIEAADHSLDGAYAFNLGTAPINMGEVARLIMEVKPGVTVTYDDRDLPFPEGFDATELHRHFENVYETPLADGIQQTIAGFEDVE